MKKKKKKKKRFHVVFYVSIARNRFLPGELSASLSFNYRSIIVRQTARSKIKPFFIPPPFFFRAISATNRGYPRCVTDPNCCAILSRVKTLCNAFNYKREVNEHCENVRWKTLVNAARSRARYFRRVSFLFFFPFVLINLQLYSFELDSRSRLASPRSVILIGSTSRRDFSRISFHRQLLIEFRI